MTLSTAPAAKSPGKKRTLAKYQRLISLQMELIVDIKTRTGLLVRYLIQGDARLLR